MVHGTYFGHLENPDLRDKQCWKIKLKNDTVLYEKEENFKHFNFWFEEEEEQNMGGSCKNKHENYKKNILFNYY